MSNGRKWSGGGLRHGDETRVKSHCKPWNYALTTTPPPHHPTPPLPVTHPASAHRQQERQAEQTLKLKKLASNDYHMLR